MRGSSSTSVPAKVASSALTTTPKPLAAPISAIAETTSRPARRAARRTAGEHPCVVDPHDRADQRRRDRDVERPRRPRPVGSVSNSSRSSDEQDACRSRTAWSPPPRRHDDQQHRGERSGRVPRALRGTSATTTPARPPRTRRSACSRRRPSTASRRRERHGDQRLGDQYRQRGDRAGCRDDEPVERAETCDRHVDEPRGRRRRAAAHVPMPDPHRRATRPPSTARRAATPRRCPRPPRRQATVVATMSDVSDIAMRYSAHTSDARSPGSAISRRRSHHHSTAASGAPIRAKASEQRESGVVRDDHAARADHPLDEPAQAGRRDRRRGRRG